MATTPSLDGFRRSLEEERRQALGFSRALDHLSLSPSQVDWRSLRALHERDADAAELLYGIERGHITPHNLAQHCKEATAIAQDSKQLCAKVRSALPEPVQRALDLALQVAVSTISLDDVYQDIRAAP
jgi:hypothetical protein